ncbi:MAG: type II secretion system protein [Planctomycetota bacterium]
MMLQTGKKRNNPPLINRAGITLLEVLVAISIFAVCIVAIFQAFISAFDAQLRAESYSRALMVVSDALEYAEEFKVPQGAEESTEGATRISWEFTQNDIEDYQKLKEIVVDTTWEHGKRNGRFSLTTYFWNPQK